MPHHIEPGQITWLVRQLAGFYDYPSVTNLPSVWNPITLYWPKLKGCSETLGMESGGFFWGGD